MKCSGFRIQPDWDQSYNNQDRYIWFHQYDNCSTEYLKLERQGDSLVPNGQGCECTLLSPRLLQIESKIFKHKSVFQAPNKTFRLLEYKDRTANAHITSVDVSNSGELLLSASSDHSMQLRETAYGHIRRNLAGHAGEIYSCRFFPSGVAALTAGADMQLKIWCLLTGQCAAILAPGSAGAVTGTDAEKCDPGGHRAGILDTAIIQRGRNVVAIDRLGWLRLWDVGTQICISAIPVTSGATETRLVSSIVLEEVTCLTLRSHPHLPITPCDFDSSLETWYKNIETSSTKALEMGTSDILTAVGLGTAPSVRLYEMAARTKGCVAQVKLPSATGSIESCAFPENLFAPGLSSSEASTAFSDYGLFAGGQNGDLAAWDIRFTGQPLWQMTKEKGAIYHLKVCQLPHGSSSYAVFACRSDGRVMVYPFNSSQPDLVDKIGFRTTLELTGINCEPVRGLSIHPNSNGKALNVWVTSHSGLFNQYFDVQTELLST